MSDDFFWSVNHIALLPNQNGAKADEWDRVPLALTKPENRWDLGGWGDTRTWVWLFAMFFVGLLIAGAAWALPHGRDAAVPPIHIY